MLWCNNKMMEEIIFLNGVIFAFFSLYYQYSLVLKVFGHRHILGIFACLYHHDEFEMKQLMCDFSVDLQLKSKELNMNF